MTDCLVHRERLLESSPLELRRTLAKAGAADSGTEGAGADVGSSRLGTHLASCPACLAAAERVLEGLDALDAALDERSRSVDPVAILERARGAAAEAGETGTERLRAGGGETGTGHGRDGRTDALGSERIEAVIGRRGRSAWARPERLAAALLAVAAVALVFLRPAPAPPTDPPPAVSARSIGPDVEAPAGRNVAVLPTDNPDITVLWLF